MRELCREQTALQMSGQRPDPRLTNDRAMIAGNLDYLQLSLNEITPAISRIGENAQRLFAGTKEKRVSGVRF